MQQEGAQPSGTPGSPSVTPDRALALAGSRAVLSHESAARAHSLELLEPGASRLTVPRTRSRLTVPGWLVVRSDVPSTDVDLVDGVRCTGVVRTIRDLCGVLPFEEAVVAADSALRSGLVGEHELTVSLRAAWGRHASRVRAVAACLDARSGSVLETMLRLVLRGAGLYPISQHEIRDRHGAFVARVDFCWPDRKLVVEADGFAFHADRAAYRKDRERLNTLEGLGWRVLRFTWEDVRGRPEHVVALVRECLQEAVA